MVVNSFQKLQLYRVVSTAIIHKGGRYLIVKRNPEKNVFPGRWCVPGGGLEKTDYIEASKRIRDMWCFVVENSLRREIKEEVGLEVGELKYLLSCVFFRPNKTPVVALSFYCDWKSGKVKINQEHTDYRWITLQEAKNFDLVEGILEEIKMVDKILQGRK